MKDFLPKNDGKEIFTADNKNLLGTKSKVAAEKYYALQFIR